MTHTATVFVRHGKNCKDAQRGSEWRKCNCRKSIRTYDGTMQRMLSAKTRSWEKAEDAARAWLDQFDATKMELRALRAERELQTATIEKAISSYIKDQIFRLSDNGTVSRTRTLLGDVDENGTVTRSGKLFEWLAKQTPRPLYIADLTAQHLNDWRSGWNYKSDMTSAASWDCVKTFFKFCFSQGWLKSNPAAGIRRPKVEKGSRTTTFSDAQYNAILEAARGNQRLETFLELLRWSGMAMVDAVEFDRKTLGDDGVLRYMRQKTNTLCTVKLPEHLIALLRSADSFRHAGMSQASGIHKWRRELQGLFAAAGITEVMTEVGPRPAHPHMLRDTCAVWYLRHGMGLYGVAKVLGHSNPTITAKHYAPFVKELDEAHIAENTAILDAAKPKATGLRVVNIASR